MGQDSLAARMLMTSARLSAVNSRSAGAYFQDNQWVLTSSSRQGVDRVQTTNFFAESSSIEEAVQRYTDFHNRMTAAPSLPSSARFIVYRPSFHGEGWGNRVMALTAVIALAMGTGDRYVPTRVLRVAWY